jgi:hypothetical protein
MNTDIRERDEAQKTSWLILYLVILYLVVLENIVEKIKPAVFLMVIAFDNCCI